MVFGLFSKRSQPTFKQRVADFWKWYPTVAQRFFKAIEDGKCDNIAGEVGDFVDRTLPGLFWVFGPGVDGGHSFTLTGEGNKAKQLLAQYWLSQAPRIDNWTFHASKQPSSSDQLKEISIRVGEEEAVEAEGVLVKTEADAEHEVLNVVLWHPVFEQLPEEARGQISFLLLDEALGEFGVEQWIGAVDIEPVKPGRNVVTLPELSELIAKTAAKQAWDKLEPLAAYSTYRIEQQSRHRRGDTIAGSTLLPDIIGDFLEHKGRLKDDPLKDTGAEFAYIALDAASLPRGDESEGRGRIEDELQAILESQASGLVLGGAHGTQQAYIDLLLFDGDESRKLIKESLQLNGRWTIESFA